MNEYKEECFKRFENTQKYKKYNTDELIDEIFDLHQELDQYKNNWEELKKWLNENIGICSTNQLYANDYSILIKNKYQSVLNKMKEIEENN